MKMESQQAELEEYDIFLKGVSMKLSLQQVTPNFEDVL